MIQNRRMLMKTRLRPPVKTDHKHGEIHIPMMVSRADICLLTKKKIIHFNASFLFFLSKNSFNFYENFAVSVFFFSKSRRVSRAHNKGRSLSLSVQIYQPHIIQTQVKTCSSRIGHCVHSVNKCIVWSLSSRELRR